jgi:hypothetical protein
MWILFMFLGGPGATAPVTPPPPNQTLIFTHRLLPGLTVRSHLRDSVKKNATQVRYVYTPLDFPSIYGRKTRALSCTSSIPDTLRTVSPPDPGLSSCESRGNQ